MPPLDRPREKALRYGIDKLPTEEILALLIGSGGKDNSALDIAKAMMDDSRTFITLANKSIDELKEYKGISNAKALNLSAVFELAKRYQEKVWEEDGEEINNEYLYKKYATRLISMSQEMLVLIILNKRKQVVHEITLYKGGHNKLSLTYRDIFKQIIIHNGYYFYVIHNHPDNTLHPSKSDISFTGELTRRCDKLDIVLMDHLIFTENGYYSFLDEQSYEAKKNF